MDDFDLLDEDGEPVNIPTEKKEPEIISLSDIMNESVKEDKVIPLDRLFPLDEDEEVIDVYEEQLEKEKIKQKKIGRIQIGLIVFLIVFASLVYLFGYDFFEPFIKID